MVVTKMGLIKEGFIDDNNTENIKGYLASITS